MFIQTEETPNPATVKFLPGQEVLARGTAEFKSEQEAGSSPLAQRLFGLQGVSGVFLGSDFVSVSKSDDTDWSVLTPMVLGALMEHLSTGQPIVSDDHKAEAQGGEEDDEITAQIKELIEERVRPSVMMDGGDIVFDSFEDGVVHLRMQGACSGCPSSTATLKQGIENMLKHYIPEVIEVRPVED
ncbi:MAG: iron transporter [Micavibrio sp.]|nr:MAG: iron transporter [Micavibrio sp.]